MTRRHKSRRGVVILIVLSLLVLFVLLAVTFAIVAGQYRRAAEAQSRQEWLGVPAEKQLDSAVYQVVRDSPLLGSAIRCHGLLTDLYGTEGFAGSITSAANAPGTDNQFLDVNVQATVTNILANSYTLRLVAGNYNGCVFTVLTGPARGATTRIVGYSPPDTTNNVPATFRIVTTKTPSGRTVSAGDLTGQRYLVNGRAFNGTGVGFNPSSAERLDGADSVWSGQPTALLPNYAWVNPGDPAPAPATDPARFGDFDESYDAADFQNMFLALMLPNPGSAREILPSFHRPDLIRYWAANSPGLWAQADFKRRVVLRPLSQDHPNFTGSNPAFTLDAWKDNDGDNLPDADADGDGRVDAWDVDNDGDGVADSIWLDLGFPVQTSPDGLRYKPLFAILITDQDGKLNVNAHDRLASVASNLPNPVVIAGGGNTSVLPRGQGYGPPEISLGQFGLNLTNLMTQRYAGNGAGAAGMDLMTPIRFFEYPANYFSGTGGAFRSPPDLQGELRMGLNMLGQPQFEQSVLGVLDMPFEFDLSLEPPTGDKRFTAAEFERVLRRYDLDVAQLPDRLANLLVAGTDLNGDGNVNNADHNIVRSLMTTDSYDLPVPNVLNAREPQTRVGSVIDLLRGRLVPPNNPPPNWEAQQLDKMLAPDLILGLRLDLNRLLGDAADNNGNSAIDDPAEVNNNELVWGGVSRPEYQNVPLNHTNGADVNGDGTVNNIDRMLARQLLARHLYVLAWTLAELPTDLNQRAQLAQRLAQWAINAVDFRDTDAIMTAFEYDPNPFDGWDVDGDVTTPEPVRGVVWGCERPELLISETLAWHDRRTEDLDNDDGDEANCRPGKGKGKGKGGNWDDDYDQRLRPRSAFFVELYNPWNGTDTLTTPPREVYGTSTGNNADLGVQLNRATPGNYPVWRLLVMDRRYPGAVEMRQNPDETGIDAARGIYFLNPGPLLTATPTERHGRRKYFPQSLPVASIKPGQYAVVGPAGVMHNGEYCSFAGRTLNVDEQLPNLDYDNTRRVALIPNVDSNVNQVKVYQGNGQPPQVPAGAAVGIVINQADTGPTPLSITEPNAGYPLANWDPALAGGEGAYAPPRDAPVDNGEEYATDVFTNGTTYGFAVVHLQRLADPTRDYHVTGNPYRTIDSASVDLTAFNGLNTVADADDEPLIVPEHIAFDTRQRGDHEATLPLGPNRRKLWKHEPDPAVGGHPAADTNREPGATHFFDFYLMHTFGSLNTKYVNGGTSAFPWMTWNDRPYVSQYELLQVPKSSSYDLLRDYEFDGDTQISPYDVPANPHCQQLLNFFQTVPATDPGPYAYRLLEFVHVPSRFAGTEMIFNPSRFATATGAYHFYPPFNRLSNFRDPGRVNLNTIVDARVWNGVVNGFPAPSFDQLLSSRRGYGGYTTGSSHIFRVDQSLPTLFANPFRAAGSGGLVPLSSMRRNDIETTLLRSTKVDQAGSPNPGSAPRFQSDPATVTEVYRDSRRNPYFRYQNLQRLGNLVTTHSNVFAVWITVGYFEAESNPNGIDTAHPDGYRLGQEIGLDTGEVKRHRAFYLIDRSIPVAYEPGENHNVDRCIVLRRFIE